MLRSFRHTLFLILQLGVLTSGGLALAFWPRSAAAIGVCVAGSILASLLCERIARRYLRNTLGRLRRAADALGKGRHASAGMDAQPGDDFYKLVVAINQVAARLADAHRAEQRLADELRRRERLAFLGELSASIAHEINNPLDGVQNCARILRRGALDGQRQRHMLELMEGGLARIELIVRRLLALGQENVIRPEPTQLREVVDAAIAAVADRLAAAGVVARVSDEFDDVPLLVDRALLEQVFVNLLINAADSMPAGGEIEIRLFEAPPDASSQGEEPSACVEIADRGGGIPPEALPHIFEPFFTTKARGRGTGLGLALAARVLHAHHGQIDVAPRPGGGTVFTVRIPRRPLPERAGQLAELTASTPTLTGAPGG